MSGHAAGEPSKRWRAAAHKAWHVENVGLERKVLRSGRDLENVRGKHEKAERLHGRPLREVIEQARPLVERATEAERGARLIEEAVLRSGPAGLGERKTVQLLGRRDELSVVDRRRYDELAGRFAVSEVSRGEKEQEHLTRRKPTEMFRLGQDLTMWRHAHKLPLSDRQTRLLERQQQIEIKRSRGHDLGYGFDR